MPRCQQKVIEFGAKIDHGAHPKLCIENDTNQHRNKTSSEQKRHETERARSGINTNKNMVFICSKRKLPFRIEAPAVEKRFETRCRQEFQNHRFSLKTGPKNHQKHLQQKRHQKATPKNIKKGVQKGAKSDAKTSNN